MPQRDAPHPASHAFLTGGGALGKLIEGHDWARTPVGPMTQWSSAMRGTVSLILQSSVPMATLWGEEGVMIYNDAYAVVAGQRHPQVLGAKVREAWSEIADFNDHVIKTCLAGNTLAFSDQKLTLLRDRVPAPAWLNLDYSPVRDDSGQPIGVLAVVVETTAKVNAIEQALAETTKLRQMFEQGPGFMALMMGHAHVFEFVNPAYLQLVGHRDVLGKSLRDVLPELQGQGMYELLDNVFATGEAFSGTAVPVMLSRTPDAVPEVRHVDLVFQPIKSPDGSVIGVLVQGVDVSERVLAEEAVKASEAEFRAFAQAMPNHVWAATPDGMLDGFNDRVYDYSGADRSHLAGAAWTAMVHPDDRALASERWAAALLSGNTYEAEFRLRRASGDFIVPSPFRTSR